MAEKIPMGFWKDEGNIRAAALSCDSVGEFKKEFGAAYHYLCAMNLLKECTQHMTRMQRRRGYWTYERCADAAKQFKTKASFRANEPTAYSVACQNGFVDEVCSHMEVLKRPNGFWDVFQNCKDAADECETITEFHRRYGTAYAAVLRNGWEAEIIEDMRTMNGNGYWTIDKCRTECDNASKIDDIPSGAIHSIYYNNWHDLLDGIRSTTFWTVESAMEEARKHETRTEFYKTAGGAVAFLRRHGLYEEACQHMRRIGDAFNRCVYVIQNTITKELYVGLTHDTKERILRHRNDTTSSAHVLINTEGTIFTQICEYIEVGKAAQLEKDYIRILRTMPEWTVLNRSNGGEV